MVIDAARHVKCLKLFVPENFFFYSQRQLSAAARGSVIIFGKVSIFKKKKKKPKSQPTADITALHAFILKRQSCQLSQPLASPSRALQAGLAKDSEAGTLDL